MKIHTTNYFNTLIEIAEDCPVAGGMAPPENGSVPSVASLQFQLISRNPYRYTSDEVLFTVFADRNDIIELERPVARTSFFSKGQPCMRCSPLTKRFGWGVHYDENGKMALYSASSDEYMILLNDPGIRKVKAMRSKRV